MRFPELSTRPIMRCTTVSAIVLSALLSFFSIGAQEAPAFHLQVDRSPHGMVSTAQPLATWAGVQILEAGGNAADAAVAAAFAIAVVEPTMNSIGGRTQILVRLPSGGIRGIDATTQAPSTYDSETAPRAGYGYAVIGVPGAVAGLVRLQAEFGTLPLETVMEPAIRFAREGFPVNWVVAGQFLEAVGEASEFEGTRGTYLKPDGSAYREGEILFSGDLARTLETISKREGEDFYRGEIARRMSNDILANGGFVTMESLDAYRAEDAVVVTGSYRGLDLVGTYVPSAGALVIEALHILETFDLASMAPAERAVHVAEALELAVRDRRLHGPVEMATRLTSKAWAVERAREIRMGSLPDTPTTVDSPRISRDEEKVAETLDGWGETGHTTHLSTADADGMMVALTQTLGPNMGSKVVTPGLGFLYASTLGGYLGSFGPGGRAWSNIAPFMLLKDGSPYLVLGAAGGGDIPVSIVNAIVHHVDGGLPFPQAVEAPRVGPALGARMEMEVHPGAGWSPGVVEDVEAMGFEVVRETDTGDFGRIHGIRYHSETGLWEGVADPDWGGSALGARSRGQVQGQGIYDVIIRNGKVFDGMGNPWFYADVALEGDRIAAVGDLSEERGRQEIDATGLYVAPGFIDTHTHAGGGLATAELSHARPLLAQGLTMILANPDGRSPLDLAAQRDAFMRDGLGVNVGQMVGHGSLREAVIGMENRFATNEELEEMKALLRAGLQEGAWGFSAGPFYTPGSYSDTREHVELGKVAAEYGVPYQSHVRDESDYSVGVVDAVEEVITVAREAEIPGVFTHAKVLGPNVWGFSQAIVHRIERARAQGVEVWADQYPYPASATGLSAALLPRWAQSGGQDSLAARLADRGTLARIREEMVENLARRGGADRIQFRRYRQDPSIEGRLLSDVAAERGMDPIDLSVEFFKVASPSIVSFNMDENDIYTFMKQPWTMASSDGDLVTWMEGVPHPRAYGAFPRKIRHYVLDEGIIDLAFAIRSMTSLPAQVYRIPDRGLIQEGMAADVIVFDLDTLRDHATFTEPHQLSEGMVHVFVNGSAAIRDREFTGTMAGKVLQKER
ncbi:MAG: amidohydrolase family protein [Gemmatimonadetes bacterium]|nr:gamma-glutamyltransferase [Gemmatimonadota bacterium]NNM06255.1 amidohydrolase family protein [Gemmatimonadota bacterium]